MTKREKEILATLEWLKAQNNGKQTVCYDQNTGLCKDGGKQ